MPLPSVRNPSKEGFTLASSVATSIMNLGFLSVMQEASGYFGGYLVTNQWGRPMEFRLSTAVQPNRVQKILYAGTLQPYICSEVIGKTLVEKTGIPVDMIITDTPSALDLRLKVDVPVVWIAQAEQISERETPPGDDIAPPENAPPILNVNNSLHCHGHFPEDVEAINEMLNKLVGVLDLSEPFFRVREAMGEARKIGVGSRNS